MGKEAGESLTALYTGMKWCEYVWNFQRTMSNS